MSESHSALIATPKNADASKMQAGQSYEGSMSELRASASMMRLEPGLYCMILAPSSSADSQTGLPGVRITPAPGPAGRPDSVEVRTISADGWMSGFGDAALVRVLGAPAFVMVTIYLAPGASKEGAPNLQVLPLISGHSGAPVASAVPDAAPAQAPVPAAPASAPRTSIDIIAHIQTRGDVGAVFGEWLGERGSGKWTEGFGIAPTNGVDLADIEYQVVLGRGWLSPWVEGGQYCGSRGMALPMLGLRVRLRGAAAQKFDLRYTASFVDGTLIGPVAGGEACEAESLSPVEALLIELAPKGGAGYSPSVMNEVAKTRAKPAIKQR